MLNTLKKLHLSFIICNIVKVYFWNLWFLSLILTNRYTLGGFFLASYEDSPVGVFDEVLFYFSSFFIFLLQMFFLIIFWWIVAPWKFKYTFFFFLIVANFRTLWLDSSLLWLQDLYGTAQHLARTFPLYYWNFYILLF